MRFHFLKLYDMNLLYEGFKKVRKASGWKDSVQKFEVNALSELAKLSEGLKNGTYKISAGSEFFISERGKTRRIHSGAVRDKVVQHVLCDFFVNPAIEKYLYTGNSASRKGLGVTHARKRIEKALHNHHLHYGTNKGYVAIIDFSKFYDSIPHDKALQMFESIIDKDAFEIFRMILESFEKNGEKKSVDIGDQLSQSIGVFYPTKVDNYVTCVRHHRDYGRYMDDMWILCRDKQYLQDTLRGVIRTAERLGLIINKRKTRICKIGQWFTFLQRRYRLEENGRVAIKIKPSAVTRERRRLKKFRNLINEKIMKKEAVINCFKSWYGDNEKVLSKKQKENIIKTYEREVLR